MPLAPLRYQGYGVIHEHPVGLAHQQHIVRGGSNAPERPGLSVVLVDPGGLFTDVIFHVPHYSVTRFELAQVEDAPLDLAIEDFERAIALDPFNYLLKSFVADFYERQGLDDLALKHRLEIYTWIRPLEPGGP